MRKSKRTSNAKTTYLIYYPQLVELLRLLSSPFEVQKIAFPNTEYPPREIADELEINHYFVDYLSTEGLIKLEELRAFNELYQKTEIIKKDEWTLEAMSSSLSWQLIREMALETLKVFKADYSKPNLYWYPL